MIRQALLSFYRSLTRHPLYAILNLLGLSFGIAVFIVLSLFVRFETSYDRWLPNADKIYVVSFQAHTSNPPGLREEFSSPAYILDALRLKFPSMVATRVATTYVGVRKQGVVFPEESQLVDADFFRVLDIPLVAGSKASALSTPDGVILSGRMARKYFGRTDVVGRSISIIDTIGSEFEYKGKMKGKLDKIWHITGVFENFPGNSNLKFDFVRVITPELISYDNNLSLIGQHINRVFVYSESKNYINNINDNINNDVDFYISNHSDIDISGYVRKMYKYKLRLFIDEHLFNGSEKNLTLIVGAVGCLALLVALVNYANISIVRSSVRAREIALRKVGGGMRLPLTVNFIWEAGLFGLTAMVLAFSIVELILPLFNRVGGLALKVDYVQDGAAGVTLAAFVVVCTLISGLYPAITSAAVSPANILSMAKAPADGPGGVILRECLAVFQFAVATSLFIVVAGLGVQVRHIQSSDLGYTRDNLLMTDSLIGTGISWEMAQKIYTRWRGVDGVENITAGIVPGRYAFPAMTFANAVLDGKSIPAAALLCDQDFFQTYGTKRVEGRFLSATDDLKDNNLYSPHKYVSDAPIKANVVIDTEMVKALALKSASAAIGQSFTFGKATFHIVGVVQSQRFRGPTVRRMPSVYLYNSLIRLRFETIIKYSGAKESSLRWRLEDLWREIVPDLPLELHSARQELDYFYINDRRNTWLFATGAGAAGLIGAIGLFGMAAFNTSRRVHEIGIRKSMGASRRQIARLLVFQFLRPVLIANVIAWPMAYLILDTWLKSFDDRVAMSPFFFLAGSGLSLLIAIITVAGIAWTAASASPAKALRYE